jgi:glutamine amidotransferase
VIFHVFLSFLHDAGKLDDGSAGSPSLAEALRASLAVVDGIAAEVGAGPGRVNILVTNGEVLVAVHKNDSDGARMYLRELAGKADAEAVIGDEAQIRRQGAELSRMRFTLVASDVDEELRGRWKALDRNVIVTASRSEAPRVAPL